MEEMPREDSVRASSILHWNKNEVNFQKMVQLAIFMRISHYYTIWQVEFNRAYPNLILASMRDMAVVKTGDTSDHMSSDSDYNMASRVTVLLVLPRR
jgi:hypothetical protein